MLRQRLSDDMKAALKAGQKERLGVIRLMISAMKAGLAVTIGIFASRTAASDFASMSSQARPAFSCTMR